MLTGDMLQVYRRLLVLGLLCGCLYVFGFSSGAGSVGAVRLCTQDCIAWHDEDLDRCASDCPAGTCSDYASCIQTADNRYHTCLSGSYWCTGAFSGYSPHCSQVEFGSHCPDSVLPENCNSSTEIHQGYRQLCDYRPGGCTQCPPGESCPSINGTSPCY